MTAILKALIVLELHLQIFWNFWIDNNKIELKILGEHVVIIPWKVASMRLPSPVLIHDILPSIFVASHLRKDESTFEPRVQWPGHVVEHPPSPRPVALLLTGIARISSPSHRWFLESSLHLHLHFLASMLDRHLNLCFLASVKQEGGRAGDDEEGHKGAHDAPHSNRSMEHRHLGGGFCLHSFFRKVWCLAWLPSFVVYLSSLQWGY